MNAVTFFAVAAIAVLCALLLAVGGLAAFLWAGAAVIARTWQAASEWRSPGAAKGLPETTQGPQ